jgi:hypothetical protein
MIAFRHSIENVAQERQDRARLDEITWRVLRACNAGRAPKELCHRAAVILGYVEAYPYFKQPEAFPWAYLREKLKVLLGATSAASAGSRARGSASALS